MQDKELLRIWKSNDKKLAQMLTLNKKIVADITTLKISKTINQMRLPKQIMLFLGIPYCVLLYFLAFIGFQAGGVFFTLGFGIIAFIMTTVIMLYFYHLYLINRIDNNDNVVEVQEQLSKLKIASFNSTKLSILQLPFWSICWINLEALQTAPLLYGGINLVIFIGLGYLSYSLYQQVDPQNMDSKINQVIFSGNEWEPILKSTKLLEQLNIIQKNREE